MASIDKIFCSCEKRKAKFEGSFEYVIAELKKTAGAILHIGDNIAADYEAPRKLGLNALHLVHHNDGVAEITRNAGSISQFCGRNNSTFEILI